ncbi:MAG: HEAT repeat domain-containing protein [Planctomycetes bacterium]|nr:HEAT repeat domain-containing protein [Planctomycetota bacterium]
MTKAAIALTALLLSSATPEDLSQLSERDLLARIMKETNQTPTAVFEELGKRKTKDSFNALEKGYVELTGNPGILSASKAFVHFKGVAGLERAAIKVLYDAAHDAKQARRRNATIGLALFPEAASSDLHRLVDRSDDPVVRANALKGLLPALSESAKKRDLRKVTENLRLTTTLTRGKAVKALKAFLTNGGAGLFKGTLTDKDLSIGVKRIIAQSLSESEVEGVNEHLLDALKASEESLVYAALVMLAERGCDDYGKHLSRLMRSKDKAIRQEALVAQAKLSGGDPTFLERLLDQAEEDDPVARSAAAISLAAVRTPDALSALYELLNDPEYSVRFQAVEAILAARHKSSISPLLRRLDKEKGVMRPIILNNLRLLTGEDFGNSARMWLSWWKDHQESFQIPSLRDAEAAEAARGERKDGNRTKASFYGMRIISNRLCFVIDNSGSMTNKTPSGKTRLKAMQDQLKETLENLQDGTLLNLAFFAARVELWADELKLLNTQSRADAIEMISEIGTSGATMTYEGLLAGLSDPRVDTIYLLTDGTPYGGSLPNTGDILREISRINSVRHVVIHCVSVGQDSAFLQSLAEQNNGDYTRVD